MRPNTTWTGQPTRDDIKSQFRHICVKKSVAFRRLPPTPRLENECGGTPYIAPLGPATAARLGVFLCSTCVAAGPRQTDLVSVQVTERQSAGSGVPNMEDNGSEPYDGVHVLLLGWEHEDDDLHGNKAMRLGLQKLENVFQGFFNYMTYSTWRIPIEASTAALNARLREFRDQYNHRGNLLIIYYAGHGATDANRNLSWLWYVLSQASV